MRVGILGGGQLARMMILEGTPLGMEFWVVDPADAPCASGLAQFLQAEYDDPQALAWLSKHCDVVTFDFENVPTGAMQSLAENVAVYPPPTALGVGQDRLLEKQLFERLEIPVGNYRAIDTRADLLAAADALGYPLILKTRRFGYDGKGQALLREPEDMERAWQRLGDYPLIAEQFVDFEGECSILAVRSTDGDVRFWPLGRNVHRDGMLTATLAPWNQDELREQACDYSRSLLEHFDYVGVLALELFVTRGGLLANELAPRVHNSGHWTLDGAVTSQFENHLRAVTGLPLGSTAARGCSLMLNIVGQRPDPAQTLRHESVHMHDYCKSERPGRKIGHLNLVAGDERSLFHSAAAISTLGSGVREDLEMLSLERGYKL